MPGNTEGKCNIGEVKDEKEKCWEKLNQMQKYLPFLDFMIDKIKKKNNEISLECQLSKFQLLRSMISEKNGKYNWDVIVKVEDVIEKLISKLDFKDQYKEHSVKKDSENNKTGMAASLSIGPSSSEIVSAPTSSNSQAATINVKPQDISPTTVDLIMKTLKISTENNINKSMYRSKEVTSPMEPNQSLDVSRKIMETDLDKDLDGFDLTDCSNLLETDSSNAAVESVNVVPEKVSSHEDVLSSSREKLLKSLQSRLCPGKTYCMPSQSCSINTNEKVGESQNISAFSRNKTNLCERKSKGEFLGNSEHNVRDKNNVKDTPFRGYGKNFSISLNPIKSASLLEKTRDEPSCLSDFNLKQKLKEKLSTDICEVYRVPGRSVGGSLRSLKESKSHKKTFIEEDELFKPDKIIEKNSSESSVLIQSKSSVGKKNSQSDKCHRESSGNSMEKKGGKSNEKTSHKHSSNNSGKIEKTFKKSDHKNLNSSENRSHKDEFNKDMKTEEKVLESNTPKDSRVICSKEVESKSLELDKVNDEELLEFVKENMQSLPHLAKLKPAELRKTVQSSLLKNFVVFDTDDVSEISDDSFQDLDDAIISENKKSEHLKSKTCTGSQLKFKDKTEKKEVQPIISLKKAQVDFDSGYKTMKRILEQSEDIKHVEVEGKGHDVDDISLDENMDEEDYAVKLIEETTPKTYPPKKKGLLELPMPITDDLFDDISSIESFETSASPPDIRDPRLAKLYESVTEIKSKFKSKLESNSQLSPNSIKITKEVFSTSSTCSNPVPSKENNNHGSKSQSFGSHCGSTDSYKEQRSNQERSDVWVFKTVSSHGTQDGNQFTQFNSTYCDESSDSKFGHFGKASVNSSCNKDPRRHVYSSSEPKSYAEYKRRKLQEQEKINYREQPSKDSSKNILSDGSNVPECSRPPAEKEDGNKNTTKKILDIRYSSSKDSFGKSYNSIRTYEARKNLHSKQRRYSDHVDSRQREDFREKKGHFEDIRKEEVDKMRKDRDEKLHSLESEELISPLEELYRSGNKPKTGRGYGIQNFKIPKKVRENASQEPSKTKTNKSSTSFGNMIAQSEVNSTKENIELTNNQMKEMSDQVKEFQVNVVDYAKIQSFNISQIDITSVKEVSSNSDEKIESNMNCTKPDSNIVKSKSGSVELSDPSGKTASSKTKNESQSLVSEPVAISEHNINNPKLDMPAKDESNTGLKINMPDVKQQISNLESVTEKHSAATVESQKVTENVKKCEAQVVECDSSVESSLNEQNSAKESVTPNDKSPVVSKEEITQEFVEALIRKSFQSGEGKLLLAQVKLFEEFARKLNSKKLKTIQKIINSESDSTSSSSESSSEDDKKKKKIKKLEEKSQKNKKKKKRGKGKRKKKTLSSSSSSLESEETTEDESSDKKEERTSRNDEASESEQSKISDSPTTSEELKSKCNDFSLVMKTKNKKRRRNLEFGRNFSGRKAKRKQKQKLLEQILNETPQPEANDSNAENSVGSLPKEPEPKIKPKPKAKIKTELDRLHDDIRSMFISEGVVTATGQRMCRILKQTGGNMNNVDIVKESAKMVEEEKLKKVQTRTSLRNSRSANSGNSENRSRSQSLDKGTKTTRESLQENEDEQDAKLKLEPRIALQRIDLDNFGYGIKISDDCISFKRMQGRNTALRGVGSLGMPRHEKSNSSLAKNVFLARNKRKFERLRHSKSKKSYIGKKLIDIVKNLPLKMAKMKHLQIYENNIEDELTKKKRSSSEKYSKKTTPQKLNIPKIELSNIELLHYAFEKKRRVYPCKLCTHVTKNIAGHYRTVHPDHEVLISRLCFEEAKKAKLDSKENGYDLKTAENISLVESMKRKVNELLRRTSTYSCRMCCLSRITDIHTFAAHVSAHTGEFRFQCPAEECAVQFFSREDIKFHILTKHVKSRYELYNKISERYSLTIEGNTLFGFLCSKCHFVQICLSNLKDHIARQHCASEKVKVIKINMSSKKWRSIKKKSENPKNINKDAEIGLENFEKKEEINEETFSVDNSELNAATVKENSIKSEKHLKKENKKRKLQLKNGFPNIESPNDKNLEQNTEMPECKKIFENTMVKEGGKKQNEKKSNKELRDPLNEGEIDVEENEDGEDVSCNNLNMEDCVDLKNISTLKGSDIIDSMENHEKLEFRVKNKRETLGSVEKLKVGPLEAQLLENSEVLYECYVKGCLFFTRAFDLFEKHIKISHWKTKWNGVCGICGNGKDNKPQGQDTLKLLTALKHLKLHEKERCNHGKLSAEDLIMELKLLNSTKKFIVGDEESDKCEAESKHIKKGKEQDETQEKFENFETPYPTKPLLRVRNLLGDRLSTPKADENDVVAISEEVTKTDESSDSSMMFTIENVRSLTDAPSEESEIKIEQVCSLKDQLPKPVNPLGSGKTIIVRSCPTRKIAIRPEPSPLQVDAGHINVVQPSVVGHPVVLGPISSTSPIRIISAALTPKSKFSVKPIVVSGDTVTLNSPSVMPVLCPALSPALSPAMGATTILPVTSNPETNKLVHKENNPEESQPLLDVEIIASPTRSKSPSMPSLTIHHLPKSSSDVEETDEKDTITPQRIHSSPSTGKKSLKDAKVYQEMLTKTKLCHLFKCMGIECSFTCNDEHVFTQHIGLHNAQRRLKRAKGMKTIYLRLANKTTRAFYWQQCAYCCEVMSNTNNALSQHVLEEHGHCMYQCAFCFYRAVSHSYVEIHQNLAHSQILKTTPRVIYKCKPLKVPPSPTILLEKHGRRQSVRPYHCDQCGRKFFITQEFTSHLASEHQSVTAYTCHICKNLCFKVNRLINHYKLHSYCTYQCAYCLHGTETEKEMVFHLCNFHFSQPAVMYVRALAEGQNDDRKQKASKKKKPLSNQLDALKVIVYESDTLNLDCIVEANLEEGTENVAETSLDLSAIVAELGINTDTQSSTNVTPIMQELASISDKSAKNLTVKTLLPNAEFSSENENGNENCSVLISSGLSVPSDQNDDREMNIPLGQLPLEVVNVQHKETSPPSSLPNKVECTDKNLKLNEILVNLQQKDKTLALPSPEEEKIGQCPNVTLSSAVHKLPPVVLARNSTSKISYPSKNALMRKKSVEQFPSSESTEGNKGHQQLSCDSKERTEETDCSPEKIFNAPLRERVKILNLPSRKPSPEKGEDSKISQTSEPLITNVISLSTGEFDKEKSAEVDDTSIIISDTNSSAGKVKETKENSSSSGVINMQSKLSCPSVLEPPIIKVEDFPVDEVKITPALSKESSPNVIFKQSNKEANKELKDTKHERPKSPDIIILEEEKSKDIVTVTLDSDDEKDENVNKVEKVDSEDTKQVEKYSAVSKETEGNSEMLTEVEDNSKDSKEASKPLAKDDTIRKEMELLRKQMTNETDSLLLEESEAVKSAQCLTLNIQPSKSDQDSGTKTLLSPIEEAICSLNKKLQSETEQAQKNEEAEKKMNVEESSKKSIDSETKIPDRPRTRFGAREKRKERAENTEKNDGEDSTIKKEDIGKSKKFKEELIGKDLFICGNEKCTFAAEDDSSLKDHLYVCDLSRESSVLVCPHCSRQIKQFHPYLEHLRYHGEKKFHCGLCSFSSAVDASVSRHIKQKHKCSLIKTLPKGSKEGHLVYYPKNYKVDKIDFEVNGYSPGDEDKLPLQSVYQVNVKCAKCPYFTKVRSNMVRHLKIHVKSVETEGVVVVPSTAPTNPVPCLETKERMFDKMTNLAASSQLAQAKEKTAIESLSPEEEAKLPQFVAEQMRYKCCLPDCNYLTIDDGMLKHHIKALHDEINYYSCPHCKSTVHVDVRHVTLDKIGYHLKHHDAKLYKCAHCIYFHYQKNVVEKHTIEKHPDRRYFVHIVREPKPDFAGDEEPLSSEGEARVWKCGLCSEFKTLSKPSLMDHLLKSHNTKSKYKCQFCSMKGNSYQAFLGHFSSKHAGEKVSYLRVYYSEKVASNSLESQSGNSSGADSSNEHFDTTPLWQRGAPRVRHIRGILIEEEEIKTKKSKRTSLEESETETSQAVQVKENVFCCPLCTNKKKPFFTRNEHCFRTHLYQELNYQQFACILCGKMFVDRKDFEKHHARVHLNKPQALKQTKEDHEIKFWVDQVIAKRKKQMEERKRKLSDAEENGNQGPPKKKKEV